MTGYELDIDSLLAEEHFVRRLARGLLFDEHRVDDVVQQTWLAALRNPPANTGAPRAWLSGVVRRLAANQVRGQQRRDRRERRAAPPEAPLPSADEVLAREERRREVVDALAALAEPYRTVVALRYLQGLEPAAIARRRGVPAATVRTQVHRGLEQMRATLDRRYGGDRTAWCTAVLPLLRGPEALAAGMAPTLVIGAIAVKKILFAVAAVLIVALVTLWPRFESPAPAGADVVADVDAAATGPETEVPETNAAPRRQVAAAGDADAMAPTPWRGGLRGRLLAPDGAPLPGAEVRALGFEGPTLFLGRVALQPVVSRTDDEGRFALVGLPARARCALIADADGDLRQLVPLAATPEPGRTVELGDLVLDARGSIDGIVRGPDGEARAGVEVLCADVPALVLAAFAVDRFAPEQGLLLAVPRPTAAELAGDGDYHDRLRRQLAFGLLRDPVPDAAAPDLLPLVLDGSPLRGLWALAPVVRTRSDAEGRFRLAGVTPGANVVVAREPGLANAIQPAVRVTTKRSRSIELRLRPGETVRGRVLDDQSRAVPGAEVRVAQLAAMGFRGVAPLEPGVATTADGRFAVPGMARGAVLVAARRCAGVPWTVRGPIPADADVELRIPAPVAVTLDLQLPVGVDPDTVRLLGRPSPPLGELAAWGLTEGFRPVASTAIAGGRVVVSVPPGTWTLRVIADGCAPRNLLVDVPAAAPIACALTAVAEVLVQVFDATGQPCADTEVFVQDEADPEALRVLMGDYGLSLWPRTLPKPPQRTDALGQVPLAVPARHVRVTARHPTHGGASAEVDPVAAKTVELRLSGAGAIAGVVDADDDPRAYRVAIAPAGLGSPDGAPRTEVSALPDATGAFRVDSLPAGSYAVELHPALPPALGVGGLVALLTSQSRGLFSTSGAKRRTTAEVTAGRTTHVRLAIGNADGTRGRVLGSARIDGQPAERMTLWARDRQRDGIHTFDSGWELRSRATVRPDGRFAIDDLQPRTWWFGLRDGDNGPFLHVWEVDVPAGGTATVDADLRVGRLHGVLRRTDGTPAAGVGLAVLGPGDGSDLYFKTETDARGRFSFARLPCQQLRICGSTPFLELPPTEVEILPGTATPACELVAEARYRVTIRLTGVLALPEDTMVGIMVLEPGQTSGPSYASSDRRATLTVKRPGTYGIVLWYDGKRYEATPASVEVTEPDTVIDVQVGREIETGG